MLVGHASMGGARSKLPCTYKGFASRRHLPRDLCPPLCPPRPHLALSLLLAPAGRRRPSRGAAFLGQPLISSRFFLCLLSVYIEPYFRTIPRAPPTRLAYNMATLQKPGETPLHARKGHHFLLRPLTRRSRLLDRRQDVLRLHLGPRAVAHHHRQCLKPLCPALRRPLLG